MPINSHTPDPTLPALRFERVRDGLYETPDGTWVIEQTGARTWVATHPFDDQHAYGSTMRKAAALVTNRVTRYRYLVPVGETCAVCGQQRGMVSSRQTDLGWWWHTACRATTDPHGKAHHIAYPSTTEMTS